MNRFSAFAIHLGISLLIFLLLGYLILYQWYPDFFFTTDGGWQGIRIIAIVDLVLGPVLTLSVFKTGKPGLRTDLTLIGVFQLSCLLAGTYVVHAQRPIAIVYSDGYFHSMTAEDYQQVGQHVPELDHLPGPNPKWITTALPKDPTKQFEIRRHAMNNGIPLSTLSEYYKPFDPSDIDLRDDPQPVDLLTPELAQRFAEFTAEHGGETNDYLFFPLGARYGHALLVLRKSDMSVTGVLPLPTITSETTAAAGETPA